jgi:hypothetical protein
MNRTVKMGFIVGGYFSAFAAACLAVYINELMIPASVSQSSGGMVAGGDFILFLFVFFFLSLAPTGLALYWLRSNDRFWNIFSILSLALAATGPLAEAVLTVTEKLQLYQQPFWALVSFLSLLRVFGTAVFAGGFIIAAILTRQKRARRFLLISAGIEIAVFLYVAAHFIFSSRFF